MYNLQDDLLKIEHDFDNIQFADRDTLRIKYIDEFNPTGEYDGIKALTYDGLKYGDFNTKNFAYIGFPDNCKNKKVPAMVLVHGGGGYPFLQWIKEWNNRGYAAIAISTVGVFPKRINAGDNEAGINEDWDKKLCGVFEEDGYKATPYNDDMFVRDSQPVNEMWMYHAVSQTLLAGKVLETYDIIDIDKIGAVGISWGSIILSITLGYKNNFKYAIPVYGSGYLTESLSYMRYKFILPRAQDLWLAEKRFNQVNIPVLWICMNNDRCFSANSNSKSYEDTVKNNSLTALSIKSGWMHAHVPCWDAEHFPCHEIYSFADAMVKESDFPSVTSQNVSNDGVLHCTFDGFEYGKVVATLYFLSEKYEYCIPQNIHESHLPHEWKTININVDFDNNAVAAQIPGGASCYYLELKNPDKNITVTSKLYFSV